MQTNEIKSTDCCISCIHHTGTRCAKTGFRRKITRIKCKKYQINPIYDDEINEKGQGK